MPNLTDIPQKSDEKQVQVYSEEPDNYDTEKNPDTDSGEHVRSHKNVALIEDIIDGAREATEYELNMTLWQGIRTYPRAVAWSMIICTTLVMEGFDGGLAFIALPSFNKKFGWPTGSKKHPYQLHAQWQVGLSMATLCGHIIGLFGSGLIANKFGHRWTIINGLFWGSLIIFLAFFAQNITQILIAQLFFGAVWGSLQSVTSAYVAELCPVALRGYLTTYIAISWKFGALIAAGAMRGVDDMTREDAWRIPLALQWIWPLPLAIGVFLAPESPWWLARKNREAEAMKCLQRLDNRTDDERRQTLAMIIHTVNIENEVRESASYLECFRGTNLRRTEVCALSFLAQSLSGTTILGKSAYFMEQAGMSSKYAFDVNIGSDCMGIVGCIVVWFAMKRFGRRTLYLNGIFWQWAILLVIGVLGTVPQTNGTSWGIGSLLMLMMFVYDIGVGCLVYTIGTELPSNKLRTNTIVISRSLYNVGNIFGDIISPYQLNPTAWNWGAKVGYFWFGFATLCFIYCYFRLPETKGRTYAQIDVMFERGVPARKFASYEFDLFEEAEKVRTVEELD